MQFNKTFNRNNLIAVLIKTNIPSQLKEYERELTFKLRQVIEIMPWKVTGIHNSFTSSINMEGYDKESEDFRKSVPIYVGVNPRFYYYETADRSIETFFFENMCHIGLFDVMFIEPDLENENVRAAWLCKNMKLETFHSVQSKRDIVNARTTDDAECSAAFVCVTKRSAEVMEEAKGIFDAWKKSTLLPKEDQGSPQWYIDYHSNLHAIKQD